MKESWQWHWKPHWKKDFLWTEVWNQYNKYEEFVQDVFEQRMDTLKTESKEDNSDFISGTMVRKTEHKEIQ